MAQINTVIVLRNDQTTNWESSDYKLLKGEVGIGYLENGNVIAKLGVDGETAWKDLPQIEGVFEDEITLTHNFGRYQTSNGFVKTSDAKGMTTSQWLVHALSETKEPTISQPQITLTASATTVGGNTEIGSYISAINWNGNFTDGSYEYCSEEANSSTATGLVANNVSWTITNDVDSQDATTEDGTFTLTENLQLDSESAKVYATVTAKYSLDASGARTPLNNVGKPTGGKIESIEEATVTAGASVTAYRKPFYGVLAAGEALDIDALSSDIIRDLPNSGTKTKGLPGSISVPAGSQMVIFAAKAGTYNSLKAKDDKAMNTEVTFTKVANALKVEGNNGFTSVDYDIWYVDWEAGIDSAKQLTLEWA